MDVAMLSHELWLSHGVNVLTIPAQFEYRSRARANALRMSAAGCDKSLACRFQRDGLHLSACAEERSRRCDGGASLQNADQLIVATMRTRTATSIRDLHLDICEQAHAADARYR